MILISIQPEHCKNIFNGIKTVEWRTKPLPLGKAAVYETLGKKRKYYSTDLTSLDDCKRAYYDYEGCGKVIGEIEVIRTLKYATVNDIPESVIMAGCVSREFLQAYSKGKPIYANHIENVRLYYTPKELREFRYHCKSMKNCKNCAHYEATPESEWIDGLCTTMGKKTVKRPPQSWQYIETPKWQRSNYESRNGSNKISNIKL